MNPIPSLFFIAANRHSATGARRSWIEKLPPAISVRSLTLQSRCGTSSTIVPSGSMIRRPSTLTGDGSSVTMSTSARSRQVTPPMCSFPLLLGERASISRPSRDPCSTMEAREHRDDNRPHQSDDGDSNHPDETRTRQRTIIVARSHGFGLLLEPLR